MNGLEKTPEGMAASGLASASGGQGGALDAGQPRQAVQATAAPPNGSPEALAARRAKDAERKRAERAAKRGRKDAAPLPSAPVTAADIPGPSVPVAVDPPAVPWNPSDVLPLAKTILNGIEAADVRSLVQEAGEIPGVDREFLREVEKDARWDSTAKGDLGQCLAEWGAKLLDRMGVPAGSASGLRAVGALAQIIVMRLMLSVKIGRLKRGDRDGEDKPAPKPTEAAPHVVTVAANGGAS